MLERSLSKGSVAIQGPIGIGKSSLLSQIRLLMEGFGTSHQSKSIIAVGDRDIQTIDQAARLLLEEFIHVDEHNSKIKFKIGNLVEIESGEICRNFKEGRHLAVLKRVIEEEYLKLLLSESEMLLLAVDEADKFPLPLARLIRALTTHTQQQGVRNVRFILSGVSPFFRKMVDDDRGVSRFFYKTITLQPMSDEESLDLLETKLKKVVELAKQNGGRIAIDSLIINRVLALSGGHPHLLQLLGSHLVEHENANPDGVIDSKDLYDSLKRICYEDRARVYDSTLHTLKIEGKLDALVDLFSLASDGFPTEIDQQAAVEAVAKEKIQWLVENDILSIRSSDYYGLTDEFLRVRLLLDRARTEAEQTELEGEIIEGGWEELEHNEEDE